MNTAKDLARATLFLAVVVVFLGAWRVLGLWSIPVYVVLVWVAFNGVPRRLPRRRHRGPNPN
jgi:hypothetical protein